VADLIDVMLCCRDEHGNPTGRVCKVEIGDEDATLSGFELDELEEQPMLSFGEFQPLNRDLWDPKRLELGIRVSAPDGSQAEVFFCRCHRAMVGNIFWDRVRMPLDQARALLKHCLKLGFFLEANACDGDFADICEAHDG
jgi:hypothetical protein